MADIPLTHDQRETLRGLQNSYDAIKSEMQEIGFVMQGSVTERWKKCGTSSCRCTKELDYRHGPYYQLSWKTEGKTYSVTLTQEQADLCRQWIQNNRLLEDIIKRLRSLSIEMANLYKIQKK